MDRYNTKYTHIMTSSKFTWVDEKCDACKYNSDDYGYLDECVCPQNPLLNYTIVDVRVPENPITFKPSDVSFEVRIWERQTNRSDNILDILVDTDLITQFSLSNTIDPVDSIQ